jgi:ABC-type Fe3+ transport system permease subunit
MKNRIIRFRALILILFVIAVAVLITAEYTKHANLATILITLITSIVIPFLIPYFQPTPPRASAQTPPQTSAQTPPISPLPKVKPVFLVAGLLLLVGVVSLSFMFISGRPGPIEYPIFGFDLQHTHYNPNERVLNATNVPNLIRYWNMPIGNNPSIESSPIVANGVIYIPKFRPK